MTQIILFGIFLHFGSVEIIDIDNIFSFYSELRLRVHRFRNRWWCFIGLSRNRLRRRITYSIFGTLLNFTTSITIPITILNTPSHNNKRMQQRPKSLPIFLLNMHHHIMKLCIIIFKSFFSIFLYLVVVVFSGYWNTYGMMILRFILLSRGLFDVFSITIFAFCDVRSIKLLFWYLLPCIQNHIIISYRHGV